MDTQGCGPSYTGLHGAAWARHQQPSRHGHAVAISSAVRSSGAIRPWSLAAMPMPPSHLSRSSSEHTVYAPCAHTVHTPCTHHAYTVHTPCTHCAHTVRTACMCTCRRAAAAAGLPASAGRPCAARCTRSPRRPAHTRGAAAARRAARVRRHAAPPRAAHPAPPRQACRRSQRAGRPSWRVSRRRAVAARGAPG